MKAVDCQSFAGGFTLGMARAGFEVVAKRENVGGFGVPIVDANRDLINPAMEIQVGAPETWARVRRADVVFGNPPCSGFSGLTGVSNRTGWGTGIDHDINRCMWDLVAYAAECEAKIVIMESVQLAYKNGRGLMQDLRTHMEEETGKKYDLYHVLHNNASIGGASLRRRYFMVLVRKGIKFGIEEPNLTDKLATMGDIVHDLIPGKLTMDPQKYKRKARHSYVESLRSPDGTFDGHQIRTSAEVRAMEWITETLETWGEPWRGGEKIGDATTRAVQLAGLSNVPDFMKRGVDGAITHSLLATHAYVPVRSHYGKVSGVVTGTGPEDIVHPSLPRTITYREAARIMGFPDNWSLAAIDGKGGPSNNQKWLGKGISVPCGEWIGGWAKAALEGTPGSWRGEDIGDREWLINVTNDYKRVYNDRTGEYGDYRSKDLVKEMARRA